MPEGSGKPVTYNRQGMVHLNGHILCSIDLETTGLDPSTDEIIQIAIVPLNAELRPWKEKTPFLHYMAPKNPELIDPKKASVSKDKLSECMIYGLCPDRVADLLAAWYAKLELPEKKRICPLGQNYAFDMQFLINWLGKLHYESMFDGRYRDTMCAALFSNERADFKGEPVPYPHQSLAHLCKYLKVENINPHDAYSDAVATAEVYRQLVLNFIA